MKWDFFSGKFFRQSRGVWECKMVVHPDDCNCSAMATYDFLGNHLNPTTYRLPVNGTLVESDSSNIAGANAFLPSATLKLNQRGDNTEYQAGRYHFAGYGLGLATSKETTLFNINSALQTALGL